MIFRLAILAAIVVCPIAECQEIHRTLEDVQVQRVTVELNPTEQSNWWTLSLYEVLTVFLAAAVAIVTFWYAWLTRRLVFTSMDQLNLARTPELALKDVVFESRQIVREQKSGDSTTHSALHVMNVTLILKNPGKVRINFDVKKFDFPELKIDPKGSDYMVNTGVIHPDAEQHFKSFDLPYKLATPIKIEIDYWALENQKFKMKLRIAVFSNGTNEEGNSRFTFLNLDPPVYSPLP